jgi:CDP-glucose 4,6-dehydratase
MVSSAFWDKKRVFLTGNTGFKGSWLSIWLEALGACITGFSLPPPTDPSLFAQARLQDRCHWIDGDIRDRERLISIMKAEKPDIVIHMAAQPLVRQSYIDPVGTYETNVMGTVNVLEAVRNVSSARAVVIVTTDKCYENKEWVWGYREDEPLGGYDPYSNSKGCAELVVSAYRRSFFNNEDYGSKHQTAIASARAGNVIGGGDYAKDRLIPDIMKAITMGQKVLIRSPFAVRPWQHVLEPLSGYLALAQSLYEKGPEFSEAWNFGPEESDAKPVEWIVKTLCSKWQGSAGYEIDNNPQPHEASYLKLDISKAKARLGWKPTWSLETALEKIINWNSANIDREYDMYRLTFEQIGEYIIAMNNKSED